MAKIDTSKWPRLSEDHLWADYAELLCLLDIDGQFSMDDFRDRLQDTPEFNEGIVESLEEIESDPDNTRAERDDRLSQQIADYFAHLQSRIAFFGDFYPFTLDRNATTLHCSSNLDDKMKLYVFFLFASSLRCFAKTDYPKLTNTFELLSKYALEAYLPNSGVVYLFGKNPLNTGKYSGQLFTKITNLANELHELPHPRLQKNNFAVNNTGDGGLDIVGWIPMKDTAPGFALLFGQCACSPEDWSSKQGTSSISDWQNRITFTTPPSNFIFIPMCFRNTSGEWYNNDKVKLSVVIDRLRLCNLLESKASVTAALASPIVDSLTSKEDVF